MHEYSQEEIDSLIFQPKVVTKNMLRSLRLKGCWEENEMKLESEDGKTIYEIFMRKSTVFTYKFSVGLNVLQSPFDNRTIHLFRFNSKHTLEQPRGDIEHQHVFHAHKITPEEINDGITHPKSLHIERSDYSFAELALINFVKEINVIDWNKDTYLSTIANSVIMNELFNESNI